jgi:UDP-4-amino-4,6-dideoxy-N-acetyl-beta-L-altrosamine transaminase
MIPYAQQWIDEEDIQAVVDVLCSDWLTTGPAVERFEQAIAAFTGARHAVAVSSGTAALHAAVHALGIGPGDEVIVPAMTFAATANVVVYQGACPVFADVDPGTLLIDPGDVERKITPRTRAVIAVDYAGQPCDYERLRAIADGHGIKLIADACHSLGATYQGRRVGTLAGLTAFSFHPVKHIATGEGGMIVTNDPEAAARMRRFRNHGIATDHRQRAEAGAWFYEMRELGFNYRLSDIHCALGTSQLRKLPEWLERRREIADTYDAALQLSSSFQPLAVRPEVSHARHLYVVQLADGIDRNAAFRAFRERGIGVNVHYVPVHLHAYYRRQFGTAPGLCPCAEHAYERLLSLPLYPRMREDQVQAVISALHSSP